MRENRIGWVQLLSAGYDEDVIKHDVAPGTWLTNTGDARSPGVADAVALLLGVVRGLPETLAASRKCALHPELAESLLTLEVGRP